MWPDKTLLAAGLMLRFAIIVLAFVAYGCASTRPQLSLAHDVNVPKECRAGNFSQEHPGYDQFNCTIARYVEAYERGWWIMVQNYAKDINFDDPSPLVMSGWVEEAKGGGEGAAGARDKIEKLIHVYGKQKVSEYLRQFRQPDEK